MTGKEITTQELKEVATPAALEEQQLSSNFYFLLPVKGKDGEPDEVFNLQLTVRNIPTHDNIIAHMKAVKFAAESVVKSGGRAKQVGKEQDSGVKGTPLPVPPAIDQLLAAVNEPQYVPDQQGALPIATPPPTTAAAQPAAEIVFVTERLVGRVADGKTYWKVKGGKYSKWGVTIWPEKLTEAGINVNALDPANGYDLAGYDAHCNVVIKDGKDSPGKVIKLVKVG